MSILSKIQSYMTGRKALLPASLLLSGVSTLAGMVPYVIIWFIIRELFTAEGNIPSSLITGYAWWAAGAAVASVVLY